MPTLTRHAARVKPAAKPAPAWPTRTVAPSRPAAPTPPPTAADIRAKVRAALDLADAVATSRWDGHVFLNAATIWMPVPSDFDVHHPAGVTVTLAVGPLVIRGDVVQCNGREAQVRLELLDDAQDDDPLDALERAGW